MSHEIIYHGEITLKGVSHVERLLATLVDEPDEEVTLSLCSGGGETTAGTGLYSFIKMLPFAINTHVLGWCASAAVTVFLAGERRTATPPTQFMLHAAHGSNETISEHVHQTIEIFKRDLAWDGATLDRFFTTLKGQYFDGSEALRLGIAHALEDRRMSRRSTVHLIRQ